MEKKHPWKKQREGFQAAIDYMKGRMEGEIRSLKTPWLKWNAAGCDGLEWNSTTIIGARPGGYKTLIKDQLVRDSFKLNPAENFRALDFSLEMHSKTSAIREFSSVIGKSYKYLCSADGKLSPEHLEICLNYARERLKYPIDIIEESCTVTAFMDTIHEYMEFNATIKDGKTVYQNTVITLDHTVLLRKDKGEATMDMLYHLGEALTKLKRMYPIAFIILSQLNRDIEKPERCEDGKYGNYVLESDFFGADACLMHADTLIGFTRPGKRKIRFYGPERYIIDNEYILVGHWIKCRNGDNQISFFKGEPEKMQISEIATPAVQQKRIST